MAELFCPVCPHHCLLKEGQLGRCRVRTNRAGCSVPADFGYLTSLAWVTAEEAGLSAFAEGRKLLTVSRAGCNLRCAYCGERTGVPPRFVPPTRLAEVAARYASQDDCLGVAFLGPEPLLDFEYVRDSGRALHDLGLSTLVVTNGLLALPVLSELEDAVDGYQIRLKGFRSDWYRTLDGDLATVKQFLCGVIARGAQVELVLRIVATANDSDHDMAALAGWLSTIDPALPLRLTRYQTEGYDRLRREAPLATLRRLQAVASRYLISVTVDEFMPGTC